MEYNRWNVGDGGFVARFSDGTETNAAWKRRASYMSPLQDVSCVAPGPGHLDLSGRAAPRRRRSSVSMGAGTVCPESAGPVRFHDPATGEDLRTLSEEAAARLDAEQKAAQAHSRVAELEALVRQMRSQSER